MTRPGRFITLDGPGGVGKSTTAAALERHLAARGEQVHTTTEPSRSELGQFVRAHADQYHGATLACLVAADRHDHLAREVVPRLDAGTTVVCDRYVASTLVVQHLDGVPQQYLLDLNAGMRMPDLAVILTATPRRIADRIAQRGATHRFNRDPDFPARETTLYDETVGILRGMGVSVLVVDTSSTPPTWSPGASPPTRSTGSVMSPTNWNPYARKEQHRRDRGHLEEDHPAEGVAGREGQRHAGHRAAATPAQEPGGGRRGRPGGDGRRQRQSAQRPQPHVGGRPARAMRRHPQQHGRPGHAHPGRGEGVPGAP